MTEIETEPAVYDLRNKIQQTQKDLDQLGEPGSEISELITSANLLRSNEYLSKVNKKKSELLSLYVQYSGSLEALLSSVFEIQNDLKEILKEQSSMISSRTKKSQKSKSKK